MNDIRKGIVTDGYTKDNILHHIAENIDEIAKGVSVLTYINDLNLSRGVIDEATNASVTESILKVLNHLEEIKEALR